MIGNEKQKRLPGFAVQVYFGANVKQTDREFLIQNCWLDLLIFFMPLFTQSFPLFINYAFGAKPEVDFLIPHSPDTTMSNAHSTLLEVVLHPTQFAPHTVNSSSHS